MSPDDAPAPAGRSHPARHAAATIALALAFAVVSLLTGIAGPGALHAAAALPVPGTDEAAAALTVEAPAEADPGELGGDAAARHRAVRAMWVAVLPAVVLTVAATILVAWRRRTDEPRSGRAHPGRTRAVRPPPLVAVRLLA